MLKVKHKSVSALLIFAILLSLISSQKAFAVTGFEYDNISAQNTTLCYTKNSVYAVSVEYKSVTINDLSGDLSQIFECDFPIIAFTQSGKDIYFLCYNDIVANENIYYICNYDTQTYEYQYFVLNCSDTLSSYRFTSDENSNIYFTKDSKTKCIYKYSNSGEYITKASLPHNIYQLMCINNNLYAFTANGVFYSATKSFSFKQIADFLPSMPCSYIGSNIVAASNGDIYSMTKSMNYIASVESSQNEMAVAISDKYIYSVCDNKILVYSRSNKNLCGEIPVGEKIFSIAVSNNVIYALCFSGTVYEAYDNDIEFLKTEMPQTATDNKSHQTQNKESSQSQTTQYLLSGNIIYNIEPYTTLSEFKDNLGFSDDTKISIYKYDGSLRQSGYIGTAMIVSVDENGDAYEYRTVVKGELTGEGNINSKDKQVVFDLLLNKAETDELFLSAADINDDTLINTKDLLLLSQNAINNG